MIQLFSTRGNNRFRQWGIRLILTLSLLVVPSTADIGNAIPSVQPLLLEWVAQHPDSIVNIIVQKKSSAQSVEEVVINLGGSVTHDLSFINAFAARLPAQAFNDFTQTEGIRWISMDAPMVETSGPCKECVATSALLGAYVQSINAPTLWNENGYLQGQGIGVAVVDSGIILHDDFSISSSGSKGSHRIRKNVKFNSNTNQANDEFGHGTHVAGIIGGNGAKSKGAHIGVAPKVNLINVKVSDDRGAGSIGDVVSGLQWVYENRDQYNIRVVNLSLNSSVAESYLTSPLSAAVEILWFNGVVVVVSAGNNGSGGNNGILYPPANDPFVITVGATNDKGTPSIADDTLAPFSAYGVTEEGFTKPDIVAPGTNIISLLASNSAELVKGHPSHRVDGFAGGRDYYFRMSGTSMASAVVSGAVALLLQDEPNLTPDQVKFRLKATAKPFGNGSGAGYLDAYAAVHGTTTNSANTSIVASQLLWTGLQPVSWNSVSWNSVSWNSVSWNSVSWNSVSWNSVSWNSVTWDDETANASGIIGNDMTETDNDNDTSTIQASEGQKNRLFLPLISR